MPQGPRIGALWIREQRGGGEYMTGEIEIDGRKQRIVVFKNRYRTDVNRQPHYNIYTDAQESSVASPTRDADATPGMSDGPARWS